MTRGAATAGAITIATALGCGGAGDRMVVQPVGHQLVPVAHDAMCVTRGTIARGEVSEPTVRAFALGSDGDRAQLDFTYAGVSDDERALASGELRRQVGLKLRAVDSCNVVYVMWRLGPKPGLTVQVKHNPGMRTHEECGAQGYVSVKPTYVAHPPTLAVGGHHTLRAEINGDELVARVDGQPAWRGLLPPQARALVGPAGLRTDNVKLVELALAAPRSSASSPVCKHREQDD